MDRSNAPLRSAVPIESAVLAGLTEQVLSNPAVLFCFVARLVVRVK